MTLIHEYPVQIEKFKHDSIVKFMGGNQEILYLVYGLSPQDPKNPLAKELMQNKSKNDKPSEAYSDIADILRVFSEEYKTYNN